MLVRRDGVRAGGRLRRRPSATPSRTPTSACGSASSATRSTTATRASCTTSSRCRAAGGRRRPSATRALFHERWAGRARPRRPRLLRRRRPAAGSLPRPLPARPRGRARARIRRRERERGGAAARVAVAAGRRPAAGDRAADRAHRRARAGSAGPGGSGARTPRGHVRPGGSRRPRRWSGASTSFRSSSTSSRPRSRGADGDQQTANGRAPLHAQATSSRTGNSCARSGTRSRSRVPADATVLVISRGDDHLLDLGGLAAWHFPQDEARNLRRPSSVTTAQRRSPSSSDCAKRAPATS